MRNNFEHLLLGLLWLVASLLGISFWFNTIFSFNIFSVQHWEYLGTLQAGQATISASFYLSIIVSGLLIFGGFYFVLRPRFRKIIITKPIRQPVVNITTPIDSEPEVSSVEQQNVIKQPQPSVSSPLRPPRLNIPQSTRQLSQQPRQTTTVNAAPAHNPGIATEISEIFKSGGYTTKTAPKIGQLQTDLFAIGSGDVLYVGAYGVSDSEMISACNKLQQVFDDFLEDAEIDLRAFIIAPVNSDSENDTIAHFAKMSDLREFIANNPNPPLPDEEQENFDAFSEFITTVANYIGKI